MENSDINNKYQKYSNFYDKYYKILLFIPVFILIISLIYLIYFYIQTGDIINKDTSLTGGTTITIYGEFEDTFFIESKLKNEIPDISIRKLTDITTGHSLAIIIESSSNPENLKKIIEKNLDITLNEDNSNIEFTGPSLSKNFYKQLMFALILSFILMSLVVFFLFKTFIPSIAVIFAAFSDIVMPLAILNFFEIKISAAGISAFLMLIGYSVDTDILLTTRVLKKKEGTVNERIFGAFKTGIFMTTTALTAILPAFFLVSGLPDSFRQIFLILALGLFCDIFNTWFTNAGILKWYTKWRKIE